MATQTVNGYNLNNVLVEETGRISEDIYRNTIDTTAWLKLFPQEQWDDEMGDTVSVLTYERTLPTGTQVWSPINSDSTKFCVPDKTVISSATSTQTYGLAHTAVESDPLCINDVRMSFRFREQLANVYANLTENTALLWRDRNRDEYFRLAKHKIVAQRTSTGVISRNYGKTYMPAYINPTGAGDPSSVSRLTQGILDSVRMQMITDGAGTNPMGRENGAPVFTLITSAETSDKIIRETLTRDDFRYSSRVSELLQPLGVERSYRGFYHVIDTFPARWNGVARSETAALNATTGVLTIFTSEGLTAGAEVNFNTGGTAQLLKVVSRESPTTYNVVSLTGGALTTVASATIAYTAWIPVPAYIKQDTWDDRKAGSRWVVNDAYFTAGYEDSYIYHQEVMKVLIPRPLTSAGSNVTFNANTYRGDFKWLNIQDRVENPDGSWGFFRGVLASASKPGRNQFGYVIRHRRCDLIELLDCAGNAIAD